MSRTFNLEHSIARRKVAEWAGAEAIAIKWLREKKPAAEVASQVTPHLQAIRAGRKVAEVTLCMAEVTGDDLRERVA